MYSPLLPHIFAAVCLVAGAITHQQLCCCRGGATPLLSWQPSSGCRLQTLTLDIRMISCAPHRVMPHILRLHIAAVQVLPDTWQPPQKCCNMPQNQARKYVVSLTNDNPPAAKWRASVSGRRQTAGTRWSNGGGGGNARARGTQLCGEGAHRLLTVSLLPPCSLRCWCVPAFSAGVGGGGGGGVGTCCFADRHHGAAKAWHARGARVVAARFHAHTGRVWLCAGMGWGVAGCAY